MRGHRHLAWSILLAGLLCSVWSVALQAAERVHLRAASHGAVTRLVFDWSTDVAYEPSLAEGFLVVAFERPGLVDTVDLQERLPSQIAEAEMSTDQRSLKIRFRRPQKITHFALPGRVVLEIENASHGIQTLVALRTQKSAEGQSSYSRSQRIPDPPRRRPSDLLASERGPAFVTQPEIREVAEGAPKDPTGKETRGAPARVEVFGPEEDYGRDQASASGGAAASLEDGFSLRLTWESLPPAATFRFGDDIWLLFDAPLPAGTASAIQRTAGRVGVTQLASGPGSLLKVRATTQMAPRLRRDGNSWLVDISPRMPLPELAVTSALVEDEAGAVMRFVLSEGGSAHWITDPETSEQLIVVPTRAAGEGLAMDSKQPRFAALRSQQGLVLRPLDDGLAVAVAGYGVLLRHRDGLLASSRDIATAPDGGSSAWARQGRYFDLPAWRWGGSETYVETKQQLLADVLAASGRDKVVARVALARFFFAWGFLPEAEAQLALVEADAADVTADPELHLMRAVAALLREDLPRAAALLSDPRHADDAEAVLWQAAFAATVEDWPAAAAGLAASDDLIASYPDRLRNRLWLLAAESRLGIGDSGGAGQYLVALKPTTQTRSQLTRTEEEEVAFLAARRLQLEGAPEEARELWQRLRHSDHPEVQARARLALIEADHQAGIAGGDQLLAELEQLRFQWRGGSFEFSLLLRLAELHAERGRFRKSLEMLRQAASYFPHAARAHQVAGRMRSVFREVFLTDGDARIPPLAALALYESFKELTPSGAEGDRILRSLADRLVEIDLLEEAALLLEDLLRYRLASGPRAAVGARLAEIYLLNQDPQAALRSLDDSWSSLASAELRAERRLLKARALSGLSRHADALAGLAGDERPAALMLRAAIYGRTGAWAKAQAIYGRLLPEAPPPAPLGKEVSALVLKLAVAASLADDSSSLAQLARDYGPAMATGPHAEDFDLLAGGLSPDGGEAFAQGDDYAEKIRRVLAENSVDG